MWFFFNFFPWEYPMGALPIEVHPMGKWMAFLMSACLPNSNTDKRGCSQPFSTGISVVQIKEVNRGCQNCMFLGPRHMGECAEQKIFWIQALCLYCLPAQTAQGSLGRIANFGLGGLTEMLHPSMESSWWAELNFAISGHFRSFSVA